MEMAFLSMQVKIFKALVVDDPWTELCRYLVKDFHICEEAEPADCSIVLGGKRENPLALSGKKILFYNIEEWESLWDFYEPILIEYYDELVNISGRTFNQVKKTLRNCYDFNAREIDQQGSTN